MPASVSQVTEGYINFNYEGGAYKTFYKLFGSLENRTRNPVIVLHGGPGLCHNYLFPFQQLTEKYNIPVILYDQVGNGKSTHLKEKPPTFWTFELFIAELINLIDHFGVQEGFDLVGHSWGGILASEFEVRRQHPGLKHLLLTSSLASHALWNQSNAELMQPFPDEVKQGLMAGMEDRAKFLVALKAFHEVHGCLIRPIPQQYYDTLDEVFGPNGDPTVASCPILDNWSVIDRLHLVRVPTFVTNGRMDASQDYVVAPFFQHIQKVKWVTFEKSAHMPFIEETDKYMNLTAKFLEM